MIPAAPVPEAGYLAWRAAAVGRRKHEPVVRRRLTVALLATFSTELLAELLPVAAARHGLAADLRSVPFGQLEQSLLDPAAPLRRSPPQYVVLAAAWPDLQPPEMAAGARDPDEAVGAAVRRFTTLWRAAAEAGIRVVQLGTVPPAVDPYGEVAWTTPGSPSDLVRRVNAELAGRAGDTVRYVDLDRVAATKGLSAWEDTRYWYTARQPCALDALPHLAAAIAGALAADAGLTRRCVVLDLDNTLWGGVLGDAGVDGVELGEGARGEAYLAFQRYLRGLRDRGVALAVASKNDRDLALRALDGNRHMALRTADFAVVVADWRPKSEQLLEIAERLRLDLSALVFVDDNPAERAQVRAGLPAVEVVELPGQVSGYAAAVAASPGLYAAPVTAADLGRGSSYGGLAEAAALAEAAQSVPDFLSQLAMTATIVRVDEASLPRAAQLVAKTNQFNLTGRRRTRDELAALLTAGGWRGWVLRLRDAFADHGVVGVALATAEGEVATIDTLILSCRVIGRTAERSLVAAVSRWARSNGCLRLVGLRRPSDRNAVTAEVYPGLGFTDMAGQPDHYEFDLRQGPVVPSAFIEEELADA